MNVKFLCVLLHCKVSKLIKGLILFDRNYESPIKEEVQIETLKNNYLVIFEITFKFD